MSWETANSPAPKGSLCLKPEPLPRSRHDAWEPVTQAVARGLSHTPVCSLLRPYLLTPSHSLTPSHPPVCWAKHNQLCLLCDRRPGGRRLS